MSGSGSPCGACKFLRRKCVKGCVFAPYFCHEQGATHFAAIHKVFGASNVSKLLGHLPLNDRSEAAITISYEAQARLQDPIYGCVSHIFSLQQQVVNLQAQLVALKQLQAAHQGIISGNNSTQNPNYERSCSNYPQDVQSWLQSEYSHLVPPFESNYFNCSSQSSTIYGSNQSNHHGFDVINHDRINSMALQDDQDVSFASFDGSSSYHSTSLASRDFENKSKWPYHDTDDLHSVAFGYPQHS